MKKCSKMAKSAFVGGRCWGGAQRANVFKFIQSPTFWIKFRGYHLGTDVQFKAKAQLVI